MSRPSRASSPCARCDGAPRAPGGPYCRDCRNDYHRWYKAVMRHGPELTHYHPRTEPPTPRPRRERAR